jgi:response regulator RpfG family c-di-GMP phosphodiesterase
VSCKYVKSIFQKKYFNIVLNQSPQTNLMPNEKIKILYVDDEENNLNSFKATFRRDHEVHTAISGPAALDMLENLDVDIIITDQRMPEMAGVEFLQKVMANYSSEPMRILLTGFSDIQAVIDAINKGEVYRYLTKPWEPDFMRSMILQAYEVLKLRRDKEQLTEDLARANEQLEFYLRQKLLS